MKRQCHYTHWVTRLQGWREDRRRPLLPSSLFSIPLSSFLQLLWHCYAVAHRRPPGKNEGISMRVEFSVINPVCHASVPACLSLPPSLPLSTNPLLSLHLHIHLSLPQVGELICVEPMEKGSLWGHTLKHQSARAFCFNEKLKPQQSHLHTQSAHTNWHTRTYTHRC